ncbi:MAG: hypothetical protein ACXWUG_27315 [Polyangiales bacterium]
MRASNLAVAAAVGFCTTAFAYAFFRALQAWLYPPADPKTLLTMVKIPFYFRAQLSAYAGLLAALGAHALHARSPERVERALVPVSVIASLAVIAQGVLLP